MKPESEYWIVRNGAVNDGWHTNYRIALREFLTGLCISDLAVITRPKNNGKNKHPKPEKINVDHVLYHAYLPNKAIRFARAMRGGAAFPPVQLERKTFHHLVYYVVSDGNHRAAAAAYLCRNSIKATIRSETDLSKVDFISRGGMLYVEHGSKGNYLHSGVMIQTEIEKIVFSIFENYANLYQKEG